MTRFGELMRHQDQRYHVIVLSNFARGFDKYALAYGKAGIPESSYPDRFHLLTRDELAVGVDKAQRLLDRLAIPGDRLLALETAVCTADPAVRDLRFGQSRRRACLAAHHR
jgi:hypothetical protein